MTELFTDTVLNMMTTTAEPEDYTGEDGLLYCGKCRTAKEAYFPKETAAWLGYDKHPTECDCQREKRLECESAEERRRHLDTVMELKRRGFTDLTMQEWTFAHDNGKCPQMKQGTFICGALGADERKQLWSALVGQGRHRKKLFCRVHCQCPYGTGNLRPHDKLFCDTE